MTIKKVLTTSLTTAAMIGAMTLGSSALARENGRNHDAGAPVVYVESQGQFYDSIVLTDLPAKGSFQQLFPGEGPSGLATEFGPGDTGYLGGRWWVDGNENGVMDDPNDPDAEMGDAFFLCPLLGPGRDEI